MLTPLTSKLTMKVIGAMNPCQRPPRNPAGLAPGNLYFDFNPATERIFSMVERRVIAHSPRVQELKEGDPV
jgi:hypothetical protein